MNVLITGGAGYIGSHVNKSLHNRGISTIVLDNLSTGYRDHVKWGRFVQGDLSDIETLNRVFSDDHIDVVMHFAASAYVAESVVNPQKYYMNNVCNTINLLTAMNAHNVSQIVFSSTCATYGIPTEIPITEQHPQVPVNPYGQSKLVIENILSDYSAAYELKFVALRYFNAAGADPDAEIGEIHDPETHLIPLAINATLGKRECIEICGDDYDTYDGTCIRDYIHVSDIAEGHVLALEYLKDGGDSDFFNLSNERGYSIREVIDCVKRISGNNPKIDTVCRRAGDPPVLIGSSEKIRQKLGWSPRYGKIDTIVETAHKWHQKLDQL